MEQSTVSIEKPHCRYCEKELHGREGKIFCNVDCKNNYNSRIRSQKRAQENKQFPHVIQAIKNNYRILSTYNPYGLETGAELMVSKDELKKLGFDLNYCTAASLDSRQTLWKYCFDFCWHETPDWIMLKCKT